MLLSEPVLSLMKWNSFLARDPFGVAAELLELRGGEWFAHGVVLSRRKPMRPHTDSTAAKRFSHAMKRF